MTERRQVYVCSKCGNMVEVLRAGAGTLTCCDQAMDLVEENSTDAAQEKHVPAVTKEGGVVKVQVGSVIHPMSEAHLIEWAEVADGNTVQRVYFSPDGAPEATFKCTGGPVSVRAFCNLHGLWSADA